MLNFVSPGERSASAGHQDKLLNPRRILVNPGELVSLVCIGMDDMVCLVIVVKLITC